MVSRQPSARSTHPKTNIDGDGGTIPYEVVTPQPEPKPPQPLPKDGAGGRLVHDSTAAWPAGPPTNPHRGDCLNRVVSSSHFPSFLI